MPIVILLYGVEALIIILLVLHIILISITQTIIFLQDNGFGDKYELGNVQMFVIDRIDKVRDIIEKNGKRRITKHKKLSNNCMIEVNNCLPLEILELQKNLITIADGEDMVFVNGKGKRKPRLQQLYQEQLYTRSHL